MRERVSAWTMRRKVSRIWRWASSGSRRGAGALGIGHAEEVEEQGERVGEGGVQQQQHTGDLLARGAVVVGRGDAEAAAEHLEHGAQRDGAAVGEPVRLQHLEALRAAALDELVAEAALARARLRHDADHLAAPRGGALEGGVELGALGVAPDEAREAACKRAVEARALLARAFEAEDVDGRFAALDLELA